MANKTIRVVTHGADGSLLSMDYQSFDSLNGSHEKVGIDDCSTDLSLRGMPVYRGLIGPIPDSKSVVRYESPEVFEMMTKEWTQQKIARRRRRPSGSVPAPLGLAGPAVPVSTPIHV